MGVIRHAFESRKTPALPDAYGDSSYPYSAGGWAQGMVWNGAPGAGPVTTATAMLSATVFACLRLLSEAISTLPLDVYYRQGGARKPYRPRPAYLSFDPPQGSRIDYLSQLMLSLLTDGNAYIATPRDALGIPLDLIPLDPAMVQVSRKAGVVSFQVGSTNYDGSEIMHIPGMKQPGAITGVSPIRYARETIALDRDARRFGQSFFANGALPGAVIEAPGEMSKQAAEKFRDTWNASHQGVGNAQRVGVLTEGAKLTKVSINPDDAQFLQTREFQVPEIARIFGVPPHLIGDASKSTSWGSGLAEQNLAFGQFALRSWSERIEDAHSRLLTSHGLKTAFVKLNLDSLLRASLKDRYEADAIGIVNGFLTINEARALEDLPPVAWGDEPYIPTRVRPAPAPVEPGPPVAPTDIVQPPPQPSSNGAKATNGARP